MREPCLSLKENKRLLTFESNESSEKGHSSESSRYVVSQSIVESRHNIATVPFYPTIANKPNTSPPVQLRCKRNDNDGGVLVDDGVDDGGII